MGMKLGIVQLLVEGAEPGRNLERASKYIEKAVASKVDMILLPETIDFGWTHPESLRNAEPIPGEYSQMFCDLAKKNSIWICVGLTEKLNDLNYNTAILINRIGEIVLKHRKIKLIPNLELSD